VFFVDGAEMSAHVAKIGLIKMNVLPGMNGPLPRDVDPEDIERRRNPFYKRRQASSLMPFFLAEPVRFEGTIRMLSRQSLESAPSGLAAPIEQ
jgi:hypothetical protein